MESKEYWEPSHVYSASVEPRIDSRIVKLRYKAKSLVPHRDAPVAPSDAHRKIPRETRFLTRICLPVSRSTQCVALVVSRLTTYVQLEVRALKSDVFLCRKIQELVRTQKRKCNFLSTLCSANRCQLRARSITRRAPKDNPLAEPMTTWRSASIFLCKRSCRCSFLPLDTRNYLGNLGSTEMMVKVNLRQAAAADMRTTTVEARPPGEYRLRSLAALFWELSRRSPAYADARQPTQQQMELGT